MRAAVYLEWALAPFTWGVVWALANALSALGFRSFGRPLRTAAAWALTAGIGFLFVESIARHLSARWQALPCGRLGLEVVAAAAGVAVWWIARRRLGPAVLLREAVARRSLARALAVLAAVSGLAVAPWLVPPSLRPGLSLAREAEEPSRLQSVRGLFEAIVAAVRVVTPPGLVQPPLLELTERRGDAPRAIVTLLRARGADGSPSRSGTMALMGLLADCPSPVATDELTRWLRWERAAPELRARAAFELARMGDTGSAEYAADLLARTRSDASWRGARAELMGVLVRSRSPASSAALRAILRSDDATSDELLLAFEALLGSDAVADRAATVDVFGDESRFRRLSTPSGGAQRLNQELRPLLSDLLEDPDPVVRQRACERLVGSEPQARQWRADLWNELHGYPCRRLQKAALRAQVAASIRRSLDLGAARPRLPDDARLPPIEHTRELPVRCSIDRLDSYCGDVTALAISPDAALALTASSSNADEWILSTRRHLWYLGGSGASALAFLTGQPVAMGWAPRYGARAFDTETGEMLRTFPPCADAPPPPPPATASSRRPGAGAVSPDGALVVTGGDGLCVWNGSNGALVRRQNVCSPSDDIAPAAAAFAFDGRVLVLACPHELLWMSAQTGATLGRIASPSWDRRWVGPLVVVGSGAEMQLLVAERSTEPGRDDEVRLWSVATTKPVWSIDLGGAAAVEEAAAARRVPGLVDWGPAVAVSADMQRVLVGGRGLCLWRMADGKQVRCLVDGEASYVTAVAWAPDNSFAIAAERPRGRSIAPAVISSPAEVPRVRVWGADMVGL